MAPKKNKLKKKSKSKSAVKLASDDSGEDEEVEEHEYFSKSEDGKNSDDDWVPKVKMLCITHYKAVKEAGKNFCDFHLTRN